MLVVRGVRTVDLGRSMVCQERVECPVEQHGVGVCARHLPSPCEELVIDRGADTCTSDAMTMPLHRRYTGLQSGAAVATIRYVELADEMPTCMYYACMPNVQVRDVPDAVHAALVRRAEEAGQSLQQFLTSQLAEIAATPTVQDVLDRIQRRATGTLSARDAIEARDEERARR